MIGEEGKHECLFEFIVNLDQYQSQGSQSPFVQ
jgi:hypothetical protein